MSHHTLKEYQTPKGEPLCLHENRFFRMMFNGYFHYLDPVRFAHGVATVPSFPNGDLLMVCLRRAPAIGMTYEFPRGGVEPGEPLQEAAARELSEETGYAVLSGCVRELGKVAPDTATINSMLSVFAVDLNETAPRAAFDTNEIEEVIRISRTQFKAMVLDGLIVDGITLAS